MKKKSVWVSVLLILLLFAGMIPGSAENSWPSPLRQYLDAGEKFATVVSLQLNALQPYGEEALTQMNAVLRHLNLQMDLGLEETDLGFFVDDEKVASISQQGDKLTASLLPNRILNCGDEDAFALLLGETMENDFPFDIFELIESGKSLYGTLAEEIKSNATGKKANYKIKNVGNAKWSYVVKLNKAAAAELYPLMTDVLLSGLHTESSSVLTTLTLKSGFTAALYQTAENGDDIALYLKGTVTTPEKKSRELSYQWAFAEKDGIRTDSYKLEYGKGRNGGFAISALVTQNNDGNSFLLSGSVSYTQYTKDDTLCYTQTYDLNGEISDAGRTLSGSMSFQTESEQSDTECSQYTADLSFSDGKLSGSVCYEETLDEKVMNSIVLSFANDLQASVSAKISETGQASSQESTESQTISLFSVESSLSQNEIEDEPAQSDQGYLVGEAPVTLNEYTVPETTETIALEDLSEQEITELFSEMAQRLAGKLLIALSSLSQEDSALLRDNISEENYQLFLYMISGL